MVGVSKRRPVGERTRQLCRRRDASTTCRFELPDTICVHDRLPPGAAAVLINRTHTRQRISSSPVNALEKRLFDAVDGSRRLGEIVEDVAASQRRTRFEIGRHFFERLWLHDHIAIGTASARPGGDNTMSLEIKPSVIPMEAPPGFHMLSKPTGAACNLDCKCCFFLSKDALYPNDRLRMSDDVLERYIKQLARVAPRRPR